MSASARLCCAAEVVVGAVLLVGCVLLPVPVPFGSDQPLRSAQVKSIEKDESTSSILAKLGEPDFRRDGGRIWMYIWREKHGEWALLAIGFWGDAKWNHLGALSSETHVLVFEFDAEGVLRNKEFAHSVSGSHERYCTEAELCIELGGTGKLSEVFPSEDIAVTVKGKAKRRIARHEPQASECLLSIWLDRDWTPPGMSSSSAVSDGLALQVEGVGGANTWLPTGAFAVMTLPVGRRTVQGFPVVDHHVGTPSLRSAPFDCEPGAQVYMAIAASQGDGDSLPLVLRSMEATSALTLIADKRQVLHP